jgi:NAD(P)-dependent dehydrogenase (short-subunit alcohol dehydrogenase family)
MPTHRVSIVTGAGGGLGRMHALTLAAAGHAIVVNDRGVDLAGEGVDPAPAHRVAAEIRALGGTAVADGADVASWDGAASLVETALSAFGRLDVVVNNAGNLRDRMLVNMSEEEWDSVIRVHLKGHFCVARHAAAHWRRVEPAPRAIVNTSSAAGLFGNVGQSNYAAAKAGIAALTQVWARELARYGVRVNTVAPVAATRMLMRTDALASRLGDERAWRPETVSRVVAYLASDRCRYTGQLLHVQGGQVAVMHGFGARVVLEAPSSWSEDELHEALDAHAGADPLGDWTELRAYLDLFPGA